MIAHDLKNRFTSILGTSELLYSNITGMKKENIKKIALLLYDSSKSGFLILQNLLDWSRLQAGLIKNYPRKLNLRTLIEANFENLKILALNKEIDLIFESEKDIYVMTDEYMINCILRNLVSNAIIFTQKGGKIEIRLLEESGIVYISIKDNGIGIPPERIEKLFDLDAENLIPETENGQGAGLGLKLCRELLEELGGKIWVESIENAGTEFKISIPLKYS
jgi:signal transduction histidine kinase